MAAATVEAEPSASMMTLPAFVFILGGVNFTDERSPNAGDRGMPIPSQTRYNLHAECTMTRSAGSLVSMH